MTCGYKGFTFNTVVCIEDSMLVTDRRIRPYGNEYRFYLEKQEVYEHKMKDAYQTIVWNSQKKKLPL